MNVMALDLELNQPSNTIIQVGIVIGDPITGDILEKRSWTINCGEVIDVFITILTGITQLQVDCGFPLSTAYTQMVELYKKYKCELNFVTWGGGDHRALKEQMKAYPEHKWEFGHREFDVKTLFLAFCLASGTKVRSGLAKSMTRVGLKFNGTKHTAHDDAHNTFILLVDLLKKLPKDVIQK